MNNMKEGDHALWGATKGYRLLTVDHFRNMWEKRMAEGGYLRSRLDVIEVWS